MQKFILFIAVPVAVLFSFEKTVAQCKPSIKINGALTVANPNDDFGLQLPLWLKEGQTVAVASSVSSISVIEFTVNDVALEFSQILNITSATPVAVPEGKVWKVESIVKENNSSSYKSATFGAGTFSWKVPACAEQICIEAWGGGGGGGGGRSNSPYSAGGGGGGGGFASQCFTVVPGTTYTVITGDGGNGGAADFSGSTGGTSSVSGLISVTGGNGGTSSASGGSGGTGGTSSAPNNAVGATGTNGAVYSMCASTASGVGGAGGNGAAGGASVFSTAGNQGGGPAGGGGGGGCQHTGGKGGPGKIVISW